MKKFNNIKYERTETVISIYEAWNLAIKKSQGKFLTNANLDDLRSYDCFEKQAIALLQEDCDVVYQNFYYSFTPNLPFHLVAKCNFQSKLPVVTKANMLQFNSPHNAPMWKKSLHTRVGLFDSRYKSAADYEFWLRNLLNDAKFWKIDEALVVYYNNPTGISTRLDTDGVSEAINIQRVYLRLFGSNLLGMDRHDFIKFCQVSFALNEGSITNLDRKSWVDKEVFLFQCFEQKLKQVQETKFYVKLKDVLTT
jgi:PIN domain nuclease of toxin-antitoxin system